MAEEERSGTTPVLVLRKFKQILESFTIDDPELTLQQITRSTGLPASTCQRLVHNLVREGFLDRYDDTYRVGLGLVRWAAPGTFGLDLVRLTRPVLQQLRDETGETACLYVRDGAYRTVISLAESRHPVMRLFVVGMVMPLHAGSAGKVFLAWDKLAVKDAIGHGLARFTPRTVVDIDLLSEQLGQIRDAGYAVQLRGTRPRRGVAQRPGVRPERRGQRGDRDRRADPADDGGGRAAAGAGRGGGRDAVRRSASGTGRVSSRSPGSDLRRPPACPVRAGLRARCPLTHLWLRPGCP